MNGIKGEEIPTKTGHIFYQFGKHLCNENEPIVDRFTLLAYQSHVNKKLSFKEAEKPALIKEYVSWFKDIIERVKADKAEFSYHLHKILFYLGKNLDAKPKA